MVSQKKRNNSFFENINESCNGKFGYVWAISHKKIKIKLAGLPHMMYFLCVASLNVHKEHERS
jgi:hypothetical protein